MFVAKIKSDGEWEWAEGAGSADSDTGDAITLDSSQEHAWVGGNLRQSWCDHNYAYYDVDYQREIGDCSSFDYAKLNNPHASVLSGRNSFCTPTKHVEYNTFNGQILGRSRWPLNNHAGMFNGIDGAPVLHGCGAYIAKIKTSNGNWKHAEQISAPIPDISKSQGLIQQSIDQADYPCITTTSIWADHPTNSASPRSTLRVAATCMFKSLD